MQSPRSRKSRSVGYHCSIMQQHPRADGKAWVEVVQCDSALARRRFRPTRSLFCWVFISWVFVSLLWIHVIGKGWEPSVEMRTCSVRDQEKSNGVPKDFLSYARKRRINRKRQRTLCCMLLHSVPSFRSHSHSLPCICICICIQKINNHIPTVVDWTYQRK